MIGKPNTPQLDLFESRDRRDKGMDQVTSNAGAMFMQRGLYIIHSLSGELTGEDIRVACRDAKVIPHHHNAWGALIKTAVKLGLIRDTGRYRQMRDVRSHARRTPLYVREQNND